MKGRLARFLRQLAVTMLVCALLAGIVLLSPLRVVLGALEWVQTPVAVLIVVCGVGKVLYDTLFYDRYVR